MGHKYLPNMMACFRERVDRHMFTYMQQQIGRHAWFQNVTCV